MRKQWILLLCLTSCELVGDDVAPTRWVSGTLNGEPLTEGTLPYHDWQMDVPDSLWYTVQLLDPSDGLPWTELRLSNLRLRSLYDTVTLSPVGPGITMPMADYYSQQGDYLSRSYLLDSAADNWLYTWHDEEGGLLGSLSLTFRALETLAEGPAILHYEATYYLGATLAY